MVDTRLLVGAERLAKMPLGDCICRMRCDTLAGSVDAGAPAGGRLILNVNLIWLYGISSRNDVCTRLVAISDRIRCMIPLLAMLKNMIIVFSTSEECLIMGKTNFHECSILKAVKCIFVIDKCRFTGRGDMPKFVLKSARSPCSTRPRRRSSTSTAWRSDLDPAAQL